MGTKFKVGDKVTYKSYPQQYKVLEVPNQFFVVVEDCNGKVITMKSNIMRPVVAEQLDHCCICKEDLPQGHKTICKACCEDYTRAR